ncbi:LEAF RUST 10 DISEASE-RESISTANCE LOCUS RECEPTOR-LIKE PROTEIN KINASE-like 2.4 [Musa acuminata AAA Group]|uniref:LEAF RUST 10 DISEASE-RESISTANCE LOCUS RECEPTOR-LIKE PROTEIN KINASE-like 2.4 n=1 Tax=Musa acuminata AAA Group TaxID=214697 RepID=UPI0031E416FE
MTDSPLECFFIELVDGSPCSLASVFGCPRKKRRYQNQINLSFGTEETEILGSGGFGVVYKGQLPDGQKVAVKVLHGLTLDKRADEQLWLYRFCFDNFVKALVYEFMENGSLDLYLLHQNNRTDWGRLRENAIGIAKGIRHLHE